jgi:hypothetical protein
MQQALLSKHMIKKNPERDVVEIATHIAQTKAKSNHAIATNGKYRENTSNRLIGKGSG